MALTAADFVSTSSRVVEELQDHLSTTRRYSQPSLLRYLNESVRLIVALRPDITATAKSVLQASGTKQAIPSGDLRLIDVVRNMGVAGTTPGRPIRKVDRADLDLYNPTWHSETASTTIKSYVFDERFPKYYYVTPPVHASTAVYAEIIVSAAPVDCVNDYDPIGIDDVHQTAITDFILWMAFSIDTDSAANQARAAQHLQHAYQALGIKMQIDTWVNPRRPGSRGQPSQSASAA